MQVDFIDDEPGTKITENEFRDGVARRFHSSWTPPNYIVDAGLFLNFAAFIAIGIYASRGGRPYYANCALVIAFTFLFLCYFVDDWCNKRRSRSDGWWAPCPQCHKALPLVIATWTCPHCGARLPGDPGKGKKQPLFDPDF